MSGKMVSLRLDAEAAAALDVLTTGGKSRSEAVRDALVLAAARRRSDELRAEAERLAADPADRAEMKAVLEFMESLSDPW
jgi:Arc/MetJ-type ribon-helix-helix transcriptional regulator